MNKRNSLGPGLIIGIPTLGRPVTLEWALAFKAMNPPINYNTVFSIVNNQQVADARNYIAKVAVEQDVKYLFFLGDDTEVPAHGLRQLIHRLENNPEIDVVGGVYCCKTDPATPLVFRDSGRGAYWDWKIGEFFPVWGLGMDCTLIRVSLLKKIEQPWFKTVDTDQYMDGINSAEQWTEDLYFFNKLAEGKVYCDATVICRHWDVYAHRAYELPKDSLPMRQKLCSGEKKLLIIGSMLDIVGEWDITHIPDDYRCTPDNLPFETSQFDWVLQTDPIDAPLLSFDELKRVTKPGGKISININDKYDRVFHAKYIGGTIDGSFIEFVKEGIKNGDNLEDRCTDAISTAISGVSGSYHQ